MPRTLGVMTDTVATSPIDDSPSGGWTRPPMTGTRVGRYLILEPIGRGAMGVVFSAYDPGLDRQIAVKVVKSRDVAHRQHRLDRVLREARALARVRHPNVVAVHDVGMAEGEAFIAMEHVHGETLAKWMRRGPHSWQAVLERFIPAGRGLAAVHDAGMIHRDFKPDNVMLDDEGGVRVMDFGLAHAVSSTPEVGTAPVPAPSATQVLPQSTRAGTPAYMAPEQYHGMADAKSDQFAFCVALFEALFGYRPFRGESPAMVAYAACQGPPQPIVNHTGRPVPSWLIRLVRRGLALDPAQRYRSMTALVTALERGSRRKGRVGRTAMTLGLVSVLLGLGAWAGAHVTTRCSDTPQGYSVDTPHGYRCAATTPTESSKRG